MRPTPPTGPDLGGYFFGIDCGLVAPSIEDGPAVGAYGDTAVRTHGTTTGVPATGATAIDATGMLRFSAAGLATVPAGSQSVTVTPRVDLTQGRPKVFVTVQSSGGTSSWRISSSADCEGAAGWAV